MTDIYGEATLELPLLEWLQRRRWIREDTLVIRELPWFGRRVDIATLTNSGRAVAYELKLRNTKRAVEQAAYNKLAFDRSYVVTSSQPSRKNLERAQESGVGIIVFQNGVLKVVQESPTQPSAFASLSRKLRRTLRLRRVNGV